MPRIRSSIEERLTQAQVAISNTLADPSLQTALAAYGYTAARLEQGKLLRDTTRALYQRQKVEYGDLFAANDALEVAQQQAHDTYMRYVNVARVALKDDRGALQKLNLAVQRRRSLAGWMAQAQQFYANSASDPDILGKLAEFGISQAMLEAGARQVDAVDTCNLVQRQRKGAAQDATRARDEAVAALDSWMSDFVKIARVALKDRPRFLEKLGVTAPGRRVAPRISAAIGRGEVVAS